MPRPLLEDPPRKIALSIPSSIMAQVEMLLLNPHTGKMVYGAMSELATGLLRGWLNGQKAPMGECQKEQPNDNAA